MAEITKLMYYSNGRNKLSNDTDKFIFKNSQLGFEGSTDNDYETFLSVEDPTSSDKTITLPNSTGTTVLRSSSTSLTEGQFLIASSDTNIIESSSLLTVNTSNNFLGINQPSPEVTLHITGEADDKAQIRLEQHNNGNDAPDIRTKKSRGTNTSPTNNLAGDYLFRLNVESRESGSYQLKGGLQFDTSSTDVSKCKMQIKTHNGTSNATRLGVDKDGKFFINNGDNIITFPTSDGNANEFLQTDGSGTLSFGSVITHSSKDILILGGSSDKTSADNHDNGICFRWYDSSSSSAKNGFFGYDISKDTFVFYDEVQNSSNNVVNPNIGNDGALGKIYTSRVDLKFKGTSTPTDDQIRFYEVSTNGSGYVGIKSPESVVGNYTLTLPTTDGDANQVLKTDGSGVLSWVDQSSGGIANVAADTDPSLGGDLNVNGNKIHASSGHVKIETGSGGGYIDITSTNTNSSASHIFLRPQSSTSHVGVGNGFTPGSDSPGFALHVKSGNSPISKLESTSSSSSAKILHLHYRNIAGGSLTTNNRFISFYSDSQTSTGALEGYIRADGSGGIEFISAFTGKHPTVIQTSENNILGLIVESSGTLWTNSTSVSTAIPKVNLSSINNSKKVFGVVASLENEYEGYGSRWGVGENESQITVNSIGEGKVWVTNINGNIENGDYVTTSEISGYGRLQDDDLLHNYTVAKCTETVDWNSVSATINHNGVDYKKYLIGCTYHCG